MSDADAGPACGAYFTMEYEPPTMLCNSDVAPSTTARTESEITWMSPSMWAGMSLVQVEKSEHVTVVLVGDTSVMVMTRW